MHLHLSPTVQAPAEARQGVEPLADWIDRESLAALQTVIGELVTISVAHGASESIDLSVTLVDEEIEGVVSDNGPGAEALLRARANSQSSMVRRIIDALVDDWGTDPKIRGTWFRMSVTPV